MVGSKAGRVSGPGRGGAQARRILPVRFRVACPLPVRLPVHGGASCNLRSDPERTGAHRRPGRREPRREYNSRLSGRQLLFWDRLPGASRRCRAGCELARRGGAARQVRQPAMRLASLVPYGTRPRDHTGREGARDTRLVLYSRSVSTIDLPRSSRSSRPPAHTARPCPRAGSRGAGRGPASQANLVGGRLPDDDCHGPVLSAVDGI
jgi:hypothetical protein